MTPETNILSWFQKTIKPSNTMLYVSAVAPDTFQGDPRVLEELLKRPFEVPDAMGQQRASARFGTCLLAHAINKLSSDQSKLISLLEDNDFFQNPDLVFRKSFPEELHAQLQQLIIEAFDPAPTWHQELRTLTQHFHEGMHILRTLFKVRRINKTFPRIVSYFSSEQDWWGTYYHNEANVLNVFPPFLFIPLIAKSLVLREAVRFFLPASFHNAMDVQEFANNLVEEILETPEKQVWNQIKWGGNQLTSEHIELIAVISKITSTLFRTNQLPQLLPRLEKINKLVLRVPTGAFTILAQQKPREPSQPLTVSSSQQKIILALAKNPTASERQIAEKTNLARSTIKRNISSIDNQYQISFQGELNYKKVGLIPLLLTANSPQRNHSALCRLGEHLQAFPYCFRLHAPITSMNSLLYAILALPPKSIPEFLIHMNKWMKKTSAVTQLIRINQFDWGWYFPYWNRFSPIEWNILASSQLHDKDIESSVRSSLAYEGKALRLTREALRIIITLQDNYRLSQRQLAKKAHTSVTTAANYHNKLVPAVLTPKIEFLNPPLPEGMISTIYDLSPDSLHQLVRGLRLLPSYQIWHLSSNLDKQESPTTGLFFVSSFPSGGLIQFLNVLNNVLHYYNATTSIPLITTQHLPQIHGLPIALYKTVGQEWICSNMLLESVFHPRP